MDFYAFKTIVAEYCHTTSVIYYLSIIWFYIRIGISTPIAFAFNRSYLIQHPDQPFPTIIAPAHNQTIHSFYPLSTMLNELGIPPPPPRRYWCKPEDIKSRIPDTTPRTERAIVLESKISGPPLRQGMMLICQGYRIFLCEEIGRWPTREDYLVLIALNLETQSTFRLFVPISHVDPLCIYDESPRSPLHSPLSLFDAITFSRQYTYFPVSSVPSV